MGGRVGRVEVTVHGNVIRAVISFGDASVTDAVPVHERLDLHHREGQAKFLERPLNEAERTLARELAEKIKF